MKHLAIIADGNRRWAVENGLPKEAGHAQGLVAIERICEWAIENHIPYLTFYCFSTENWGRAQSEVDHIMDLARFYFADRHDWYVDMGIHVRFSGRRDRLAQDIVDKCDVLERDTANGSALTLTICSDYGGRDEIARAVQSGARTEDEITLALTSEIPEPDLILRTGGRHRLSNFMLWQAAYAELYFSETLFPDLGTDELNHILDSYEHTIRNFGK